MRQPWRIYQLVNGGLGNFLPSELINKTSGRVLTELVEGPAGPAAGTVSASFSFSSFPISWQQQARNPMLAACAGRCASRIGLATPSFDRDGNLITISYKAEDLKKFRECLCGRLYPDLGCRNQLGAAGPCYCDKKNCPTIAPLQLQNGL